MKVKVLLCCISLLLSSLLLGTGYASITKGFKITGTASGAPPPPEYDVFISSVHKISGSNVTVNNYTSTILSTTVTSNGTTSFDVTVKNVGEKDCVYVGTIEGKDIGVSGVYIGEDITYSTDGLIYLQQLNKVDGQITFRLTISSKNNVTTNNFILKFNFVEKTGQEILPGGDEDEEPVQLAIPAVTIDETGLATWISVANASSYKYRINNGAELNTTRLSMLLAPNDSIQVKAVGDGIKYLDSEYCLPVTYTIEITPEPELIKLKTPVVTIDKNGYASWQAIDNASSYVYVINDGTPVSTSLLSVKLVYNQSIKVMAIGDGVTYTNSDYSESKTLTEPIFANDFLGLSQVLLSSQTNCLNSTSDIISPGVRGSIGNAPNGKVPALHCEVTSISGGTMSKVTLRANQNLTQEVQYIIEPDIEDENKMYLYMYYKSHCTEEKTGQNILVYMQVIVRDTPDGKWYDDGTYIGKALVGMYYGGGKNGKDMLTIGVKTWTYGAPDEE